MGTINGKIRMLKAQKIGKFFLMTFLTAMLISTICGILIYGLNTFQTINIDNRGKSFLSVFIGVFVFFIPLLFTYFIFKKRSLLFQCIISLLIIITEIFLFLSSLYMGKMDSLFFIKLFIITLGGVFFPLFCNVLSKLKITGD